MCTSCSRPAIETRSNKERRCRGCSTFLRAEAFRWHPAGRGAAAKPVCFHLAEYAVIDAIPDGRTKDGDIHTRIRSRSFSQTASSHGSTRLRSSPRANLTRTFDPTGASSGDFTSLPSCSTIAYPRSRIFSGLNCSKCASSVVSAAREAALGTTEGGREARYSAAARVIWAAAVGASRDAVQ